MDGKYLRTHPPSKFTHNEENKEGSKYITVI